MVNMNNISGSTSLNAILNRDIATTEQSAKITKQSYRVEENIQQKMGNQDQNATQKLDEKKKEKLNEITEGLNEMVKTFNRKLDFSIHDETNRVMVKVVDTETQEVVREIPPEEILDLAAKMQEAFGILIDVRV